MQFSEGPNKFGQSERPVAAFPDQEFISNLHQARLLYDSTNQQNSGRDTRRLSDIGIFFFALGNAHSNSH